MKIENENKIIVPMTDRIQIPCQYCGEPMFMGIGKQHKAIYKQTGDVIMDVSGKPETVQAQSQVAYVHKQCRAEARRMNRKATRL